MEKYDFLIEGMRCQACVSAISKKAESLDGVKEVKVNLLTGELQIEAKDDFNIENAIVSINSLGYKTTIKSNEKLNLEKDNYFNVRELVLVLIFGFLVSYISMANMLYPMSPAVPEFLVMMTHPLNFAITVIALSIPVYIIGLKFFIPGLKSLFKLHPNMDSLITIAGLISLVYSLVYLVLLFINPSNHSYGHNIIIESGSMVIALVYLGKFIEQTSKNKAKKSITNLLNVIPTDAHVIRDNQVFDVCVNDISVGEIISIREGERSPVDGVVVSGMTEVDTSSVTGESKSINKKPGDVILAGSIILQGSINVKVEKISSDTTLNSVLALVTKSQFQKNKITSLVDTVSYYFVRAVLAIFAVVFISWSIYQSFDPNFGGMSEAIKISVNTLVIACPCALGLAIPMANIFSSISAVKSGFVYKNMDVISEFKKIDTVIFDKTGTITSGEFSPVVEENLTELNDKDIMKIIASMESNISHPIALSIISYCKQNDISFSKEDSTFIKGLGLKSIINGKTYFLGNKKMLVDLKINTGFVEKTTTLYLVEEGKHIATLSLYDEINEGISKLIKYLKSKNIKITMLTGDNEQSAKLIADKLNIEDYQYDLLPSDKYEFIQILKEEGNKIAFFGDGINDAPALSLSDLAITPYKSSDIANDSSDIYMLSNDFSIIINAFKLGSYTNNIIKTNIIWAFLYNIVAMIVASGVFYALDFTLEPRMSAFAMTFSSVSVILSSITIILYNFYIKKQLNKS